MPPSDNSNNDDPKKDNAKIPQGDEKSSPSGAKMRPLSAEDMAVVAGDFNTSRPPPNPVSPVTVVSSPPPNPVSPVTVVASPPGGGTPSPTPVSPVTVVASSPPSPTGCPPSLPSSTWAANNATVTSALTTAGANLAGVSRAISNWAAIATAANAHNIDPAMLAGIALRETDFQDINQIGGGMGRGVFQIDLGAHPNVTEAQANDINWSADYAANLLQQNMATLAAKYPSLTHDQLLQATAASYNFGTKNISGNPATIDQGTTGNNYGSNVLNLMKAFKDPVTGLTPLAGTSNGGKDGC